MKSHYHIVIAFVLSSMFGAKATYSLVRSCLDGDMQMSGSRILGLLTKEIDIDDNEGTAYLLILTFGECLVHTFEDSEEICDRRARAWLSRAARTPQPKTNASRKFKYLYWWEEQLHEPLFLSAACLEYLCRPEEQVSEPLLDSAAKLILAGLPPSVGSWGAGAVT